MWQKTSQVLKYCLDQLYYQIRWFYQIGWMASTEWIKVLSSDWFLW